MGNNNRGLLGLTCSALCWLVAILIGLLVLAVLVSWTSWAFIIKLLLAVIATVAAGWVLPSYLCNDDVCDGAATAVATGGTDAKIAIEAIKETKEAAEVKANTDADVEKAVAPAGMTAAEDGKPALFTSAPDSTDDLKMIKGVGPALEKTLNELGIYTFAQIVVWTPEDVAWVDGHLRFKGRIERDDWMSQAKILGEGGETAFSKKVEDGDVY